MSQDAEWYRQQSEYNRSVYEWMDESRPNLTDWKVVVLFYSALHRVNYWFVTQTGKVPENHAERNRRVRRELPQIFGRYRNLYMMSRRARYCEGFRTVDFHRGHAVDLLDILEKEIPFP